MSNLAIDPAWDAQAADLNQAIYAQSPSLYNALSHRGKAIYFPKLGILSQSAEARGKKINATIGIAVEDSGTPMYLSPLASQIQLPPHQVFPYAPSPGNQELREKWKQRQIEYSPNLEGKPYTLPLVTHALTHGLSVAGFLFANEGDVLISPDFYWENYDLTFGISYGTVLKTFPTFDQKGGFNISSLESLLNSTPGKKIVILNFPNNPTGYTPSTSEMQSLVEVLKQAAQNSTGPLVVLVDDAYYGLCYNQSAYPESVFGLLCQAHPNLIAVRIDGATKEDFVWGLRVGFISFGLAGANGTVYKALEEKAAGVIRATISNASNLAQSLLLKAWGDPSYREQKSLKAKELQKRFEKVVSILTSHPEYTQSFTALPFNSGYFMCVDIKSKKAEQVRQHLLQKYQTGLIAFGSLLRVAYSSTALGQLEELFASLHLACQEV